MNNDIHQVIAKGVEPPKVVVEGKAHHPYPASYLPGGETIKELRKSGDMKHRFILNNFIIKDKLAMEAGEVDGEGERGKEQGGEKDSGGREGKSSLMVSLCRLSFTLPLSGTFSLLM